MVFNSINNPSHNNLTTIDNLQQTKLKISSLTTTGTSTTITSVTCNSTKMLLNKMNNDLCNSLGVNMSQRSSNSSNKQKQIRTGSMDHSPSIGSISSTTNSTSSSVSSTSCSSGSSNSKKQLSSEDKKINLNALKNQDPFAINIIDTAFRVAVYKFMSKKNEWKKLDVEGSLFLFERMVEPLHSFVVMNTLALHLFLQPITADLEFQDRNPFLLYKSNDDIFGIWFIDKEDCDRVKSTIMDLTESARERKLKRENSKQLISPPLSSHEDCSSRMSLTQIPRLITPCPVATVEQKSPSSAYEKLISNAFTSPTPKVNEEQQKPNCDIMQMLTNAQFKFNQSESSQLTITNANINSSPSKLFSDLFTKPAASDNSQRQFPVSSNTSLCLSSSPSTSSTSTGYSTNSESIKVINPMIQKLLVPQKQHPITTLVAQTAPSASTKTLDEIESGFMTSAHASTSHDLLSEELKRKLNIKSSKVPLASSSMITTPSNPLIINDHASLDTAVSALAKHPITLKDFEENLLNESVSSMNSTNINIGSSSSNSESKHENLAKIGVNAAKKIPLFYVGNDDKISSNYIRPSQLSFANKKADKKAEKKAKKSFSSKYSSNSGSSSSAASTLSSRSSRSSTSDSSSETSSASSTSSSPRTLPLLLTPAAFETSSIASSTESTSSSSKANIFDDFLNSQLLSSIDHQQKMAHKLKSKTSQGLPKTSTVASSIATNSLNSLLLANVDSIEQHQLRTAAGSTSVTSINNKNNELPKISKNMQQATILNKPQLQQCLIHLLTSDDKFLSSLHQAYLATSLSQQANQNSLPSNTQPQQNSA